MGQNLDDFLYVQDYELQKMLLANNNHKYIEYSHARLANQFKVIWNGLDDNGLAMPSGHYFYRIQVGEFWAVRKLLFLQ